MLGLCIATAFALPQLTHAAYNTTNQTAEKVGPNTALFTVSYEFGMPNQAVYMPIMTQRDLAVGTDTTNAFRVGYQIERKDGTVVKDGTTTALALSRVPIEGTMYRIPAGEATIMTLVAVVQLPANVPFAGYRLHVTKLPFIFSDGTHPNSLNQMNKYELSQYVTPLVPFGTLHLTIGAPMKPVPGTTAKPANAPATPTTSTASSANFHW